MAAKEKSPCVTERKLTAIKPRNRKTKSTLPNRQMIWRYWFGFEDAPARIKLRASRSTKVIVKDSGASPRLSMVGSATYSSPCKSTMAKKIT